VAAEVRSEPARSRGQEVARVVADPGRARALLGWEPRIAWSQTLRDVLEDWRGRVGREAA
jgi:nucleoside-diphosphate-sugar epimerase